MNLAQEQNVSGDQKILVELYCMPTDCTDVEELVSAVANSVRWRDRLDVRVNHMLESPRAATPYGIVGEHTIVVCGTHIVHAPDYKAFVRALEDCAEQTAM